MPIELSKEERSQIFSTIIEATPAWVAVFSFPKLQGVYVNPAARRRLNFGPETDPELLTLKGLIGPSSIDRLDREILLQLQVHDQWTGVIDLRDAWGSEFQARAALVVRSNQTTDGVRYLCLHASPIGAVEVLGKSVVTDQVLLHALLESVPDGIYFKDTVGRFLRISRALAQKFKLKDPIEAIGKTDFDFFNASHAAPAFSDEQTILRTGQPLNEIEEKEEYEDGRASWVSTSKFPFRDPEGMLLGTFGISHDVTARKLAEKERREMETKLQLSQKLESVGRLAAGVAHEINTPTQFISDNVRFLTEAYHQLSEVLNGYQALRAKMVDHPDYASGFKTVAALETTNELDYLMGEIPRTLEQSLEGLGRIARIVGSLKEFSHPNSAEKSMGNLNHAIETAIAVSRHEWKYVAEVATELDPNLPSVQCVLDEFNQVILNLIVNAAHTIGDVVKERGGLGRITVRTRHEAEWAVVEVEDTGTGIPQEVRDHIFEPFFTTKGVGKGTGQGLAIVHTVIVKGHNGRINFTTEIGKGTTFRLALPVAPAPLAAV